MEGEEKKERPQNRNLNPLGSGKLTPEEELEIRRKGKKAADKARKRKSGIIRIFAPIEENETNTLQRK